MALGEIAIRGVTRKVKVAVSRDARRGSLTWAGIACGLACIGFSAAASGAGEPPRIYGAIPDPAAITAYAMAICGSVITVANTLFRVWDMVQDRRHPRRKRHHEADEPKPE